MKDTVSRQVNRKRLGRWSLPTLACALVTACSSGGGTAPTGALAHDDLRTADDTDASVADQLACPVAQQVQGNITCTYDGPAQNWQLAPNANGLTGRCWVGEGPLAMTPQQNGLYGTVQCGVSCIGDLKNDPTAGLGNVCSAFPYGALSYIPGTCPNYLYQTPYTSYATIQGLGCMDKTGNQAVANQIATTICNTFGVPPDTCGNGSIIWLQNLVGVCCEMSP